MVSGIDIIGTISIISTVVIGFLGSFGLYWKQRKDKRRKLRKALRSEVESINISPYAEAIVSENVKKNGWPLPETSPFTSDIYINNSSDIGLLSDSEIEKVVDFYSKAHRTEKEIKRAHGERETPLAKNPFMTIHSLLELNNQRNDILKELDQELGEYRDTSELYYVDLEEWDVEKVITSYNN